MTTPSKTCVRRRVPSIDLEVDADAIAGLELRDAAQLRALEAVDDGAHGEEKAARAGSAARRAPHGSEAPPDRPARARDCSRRHSRIRAWWPLTAARRAPSSRATPPGACSAGTRARRSSAALKDSSTRRLLVPERARAACAAPCRRRPSPPARRRPARSGRSRARRCRSARRCARRSPRSARTAASASGSAASSLDAARRRAGARPGSSAITRRALAQRDRDRRRSARAAPPRRRRRAAPSRRRRRTACRRPGRPAAACARGSRRTPASSPSASALRDVALGAEPVEPVREEREDVDLHGYSPRNARSTSIRRAATSTTRIASRHQRHEQLAAVRRARPRAPRTTAARASAAPSPPRRSPSTTAQPSSSCAQYSPSLERRRVGAAAPRAARRAAPPRPRAPACALEPQDRARGGAGAALDPRGRAVDAAARRPASSSRASGRVTWKRAVEPVRAADPARPRAALAPPAHSTMSTARGGCPSTAAALTTVRSACAVRPPRPMTWP